MADVLFWCVFIIEITFVAYSIYTKSNQDKFKNYLRTGCLVLFILLILTSILQWSFRWYGLSILIFIWALLGLRGLLRKKSGQDNYNIGVTLFKGILTILLAFLALIPAFIFPQHNLPKVSGKYPVSTSVFTYTDDQRVETFSKSGAHRNVNVEFWYPTGVQGKYPLVVFSHGAFGLKTSNTSTYTELASNGYVVCAIDHPYHALFTMGSDRRPVTVDPAFFQEVLDVNNGKYSEADGYKIEQKWLKLRTDDINFVLNTIIGQAQNSASPAVYQLIDPQKIGLMGHSLGAAASAQVARERSDIAAVVNLDADLLGEYVAYQDGKYQLNPQKYPVPILTILADDMVRLIDVVPDAASVVAVKHVNATAPHAYEVHIGGTDHQSLTDLPITSPIMVNLITTSVEKAGGGETADKYYVIETMNDLVLSFFNVYLKGEGKFTPAATY